MEKLSKMFYPIQYHGYMASIVANGLIESKLGHPIKRKQFYLYCLFLLDINFNLFSVIASFCRLLL